jgi:hypothetical protein
MSLARRIVETLVERFIASVGTLFAARIETIAALMHAHQQDELEERARQLEDDGKAHLAADLRSRASQLASETPGASRHEALRQLEKEHTTCETPRIAQATDEQDDPETGEQPPVPPQPPSPRPARRRSCRRSKTN